MDPIPLGHAIMKPIVLLTLLYAALGAAQTTSAPVSKTAVSTPSITAVSECHAHGTQQFCMVGSTEYQIVGPTKTEELQPRYTGCHAHGNETYCFGSGGDEVKVVIENQPNSEEENHEHQDCHFHAGVEHCVGGNVEKQNCDRSDRDYNIPLRIGLLFVILVTSGLGVFVPIVATSFTRMTQQSIIFILLKQFGTGVVLSTAFIHLYTHASLMFNNECLGELAYEGATSALVMAGLFLSFLLDYLGARFILRRQKKSSTADGEVDVPQSSDDIKTASGTSYGNSHNPNTSPGEQNHLHGTSNEKLSVVTLEAGIVFHSLLIGLTLVVAGDSFFLTLFAVILFHQMFEGIALGTCIASLPSNVTNFSTKLIMGSIFALITPIGMAIGIGVLGKFNGNDPSTLVAIGTLDALSAGILVWVGVFEMLARDWLHGALLNAPVMRTAFAMAALLAGLILMAVLGKWA